MSLQTKNGYYYVVISYRDANDDKKLKWIATGTKSEKEAKKIERRILTDIERGEYVITDKKTVKAFLDEWLDIKAKPEFRIGTVKKFEAHIKLLKLELGEHQLDKLTGMHIQKFIAAGKMSGKSGTYLYDIFATLKRSLDDAVKWGLLPKNPAVSVDPPKKDKPKTVVLTPAQVDILLTVLEPTEIFLPFLLGTLCGLRRGEICGLRWVDVDIKKGSAFIRKSLDVHDGKYILGSAKTDASEDEIPLPAIVLYYLRLERIKQRKHRRLFDAAYQNLGYCWCREDGHPKCPDTLYHDFQDAIKKYNKSIDAKEDLSDKQKSELKLPMVSIHGLRHTHATLLLRANVNAKVVSKKLRHTDFKFTAQRYQHVQEDMMRETADVMDNLFLKGGLEKRLERQKKPIRN